MQSSTVFNTSQPHEAVESNSWLNNSRKLLLHQTDQANFNPIITILLSNCQRYLQYPHVTFSSLHCFTCDVDRDDAGGDGVRVGIRFLVRRWEVFLRPVCLLRLGWRGIWCCGLGSRAPSDLTTFTFLCWGSLKRNRSIIINRSEERR